MTMNQQIGGASDRVMTTLVAGLDIEFGRGAGGALARRFLEAEEAEFRWDARSEERWLGAYESGDGDEVWFDRVAICGCRDGRWFTATMIVDGEGSAHGMLGCRHVRSRKAAHAAMASAR
ncbi:hypothetical protein OKW76_01550 [Sphingomonas sp. S1-29]|uniref:hypothetical protein n=1 Tax=Sphingomonas sp. S1-29 TaxID=2991074 RepID=UPI00223FA912|nr:hypothetical protein [Sphingomonas sp. S1-29]UZK69779.1 hypothetical protein OKW76_01550 [Sphingomonas sp. S1-29]